MNTFQVRNRKIRDLLNLTIVTDYERKTYFHCRFSSLWYSSSSVSSSNLIQRGWSGYNVPPQTNIPQNNLNVLWLHLTGIVFCFYFLSNAYKWYVYKYMVTYYIYLYSSNFTYDVRQYNQPQQYLSILC